MLVAFFGLLYIVMLFEVECVRAAERRRCGVTLSSLGCVFLLLDCLDTDEKVPTAKKAEDPSNSDHLPPTCYYGSRLQKPQEVHELLQNEPYKLSDGLLAPAAGRHSAFVVVGLKVRYLKCLVLGMGLRLRNGCRAWGISAGTSVL